MERSTVLDAVREASVELLDVTPDQVVEDAEFGADLEADSLDLTELVMALEDKFGIEVPEEQLEDVKTVGSAVDLVLAQLDSATT